MTTDFLYVVQFRITSGLHISSNFIFNCVYKFTIKTFNWFSLSIMFSVFASVAILIIFHKNDYYRILKSVFLKYKT